MTDLLNRKKIAEMLNMTPERMRRLVEPRPNFPRPALRLSRKTVLWDATDIQRWMEQERQRV